MPRKAPDKVIEHRISLSNFERTQILEQIEKSRENSLIKSGINQIGGIAGSGVLLYAVGAYFGIGLFSSAYDKVTDFVNNTSSSLADFLNPAGVGNYSIWLDAETNTLFAYQEQSGESSSQDLGATEIVKKWWKYMADIMETNPDNSPVSIPLEEVFYLE